MPTPDHETYFAATGITGVDTWMAGRARVTSGYLLHGSQPALVETGPTTSVEAVTAGLNVLGLGAHDLAHIVVTHIHLDHAGGVGDRKSTRLNSSHGSISYAVFCLKKKKKTLLVLKVCNRRLHIILLYSLHLRY